MKLLIDTHVVIWLATDPDFFVRFPTGTSDLVLDPFASSNFTGAVAEHLERRWLATETVEEYLVASRFRFSMSSVE